MRADGHTVVLWRVSIGMITIIIFIVLLGLAYWLVSLIPLPSPFPEIVKVVFVIIAVLYLLNAFGIATGLPALR